MKKSIHSALYLFTLLSAGLTIHQAFADRGPSVEPITEVSIEDNSPNAKTGSTDRGFDFASNNPIATKSEFEMKRAPANIVSKQSSNNSPYTFIGPMIFLLALPFALWIVISKKIKQNSASQKVDYYGKTFQFKPTQAANYKIDHDEDEHDYPKAS